MKWSNKVLLRHTLKNGQSKIQRKLLPSFNIFEKIRLFITITQKAVLLYLHSDTYRYNIYDNKSTKKGEKEGQNGYILPESSHH